jgi:Phage integrase, N-terminal SAM-like domain
MIGTGIGIPIGMQLAAKSAKAKEAEDLRQAALKHFNRPDAAERCVEWSRRFILFQHKRHPGEMGAIEVVGFLKHLADTLAAVRIVDELQNALDALSLVYEHVVRRPLGDYANEVG